MAERQKRQLEQERARIAKKANSSEKEVATNILPFKKRQIFA